jgi:putative hydrolase of the HAD superfamily
MSSTPVAEQSQQSKSPSESDYIKTIVSQFETLTHAKEEISAKLEVLKYSLETVTHLTEYEDEKANRILTAMAFLSALAALVFTALAEKFPAPYLIALWRHGQCARACLLSVAYLSFAVFCTQLVLGSILCLKAIRPQFNIPSQWGKAPKGRIPASFLFFQKILEAGPENWATSCVTQTANNLKREYLKNCILETFLISEKIQKKLRPLQAGINQFYFSAFTLLVLLVSSTIALALLPPKEASPEKLTPDTPYFQLSARPDTPTGLWGRDRELLPSARGIPLIGTRPLVVSDADNTLWDTDSVYRRAQLALFDAVQTELHLATAPPDRLSYLRRIDERLASSHHLRWKYPPRLLVAGLAHALSEEQSGHSLLRTKLTGALDERAIIELEHQFLAALNNDTPTLRDSVREGIVELHELGAVFVLATEANADRCQSILKFHHLEQYVASVHAGAKTPMFFRSILDQYSDLRDARFVVGDQLDRDIAPSHAAGFLTIFFPGGFKPEVETNHPAKPDFVVSKYSEVPRIVLKFNSRAPQQDHAKTQTSL